MAVKKIASIARFTGDTADTKPASQPVGSTYFDRETGLLHVNYDGTNYAVKLTKLAANSGVDVGDVDVTSIAAGDNNIGNVDIVTLPAGNLGQQAMAASLSVVPASDVTDATYLGDIKFGEALPAGTASLGGVKDDGPQVAGTTTHTASADMTTTANISAAPTGGEKLVLLQVTISVDTAMSITLEEETSGTDYYKFYLPANGTVVFVPRYPPKLATADKKWNAIASVAGNVATTVVTRSEG